MLFAVFFIRNKLL